MLLLGIITPAVDERFSCRCSFFCIESAQRKNPIELTTVFFIVLIKTQMPWWGAKASVKAADASASSLVDFHKQATTMKSIYYEKHIHRTLPADVLFGRISLFFVVVHYM